MNMGFVVILYFHAWNIKKIVYMSSFVLNIEINMYFLHATNGAYSLWNGNKTPFHTL